jgi:GAF domain-containing protein
MPAAPLPVDEAERLRALQRYGILDTETDPAFERLTQLAARLFDVPIALVSLVDADRQWFKACHGVGTSETPRSVAFCAYAILRDDVMEVLDPETDPRFADSALVIGPPFIRYEL